MICASGRETTNPQAILCPRVTKIRLTLFLGSVPTTRRNFRTKQDFFFYIFSRSGGRCGRCASLVITVHALSVRSHWDRGEPSTRFLKENTPCPYEEQAVMLLRSALRQPRRRDVGSERERERARERRRVADPRVAQIETCVAQLPITKTRGSCSRVIIIACKRKGQAAEEICCWLVPQQLARLSLFFARRQTSLILVVLAVLLCVFGSRRERRVRYAEEGNGRWPKGDGFPPHAQGKSFCQPKIYPPCSFSCAHPTVWSCTQKGAIQLVRRDG